MNFEKDIEKSVEQFRQLLTEQLERENRMEEEAFVKDFSSQETITIGLVPGDGIGPVIFESAEKVLKMLLKAGK